ncbi:MAG: hypothetical protein J7K54_03960 [Candidatus Aenigmarchaeota archaeon]|nr:hypothetical protein [Candidatus Aenigmarchaeota archaeon]
MESRTKKPDFVGSVIYTDAMFKANKYFSLYIERRERVDEDLEQFSGRM